MSDRLTVDTITSDQLDALQMQAARMAHATKQYAELAVRLEDTERERDQFREALHNLRYGMARAKGQQLATEYVVQLIDTTAELATGRALEPCDRDQQYARAEQAEAAIARVRERCQGVRDRSGPGGMINATQILGLLSPTWPDGNYEAPPPSAAFDEPKEQRPAKPCCGRTIGHLPGCRVNQGLVDKDGEHSHECTYGERCPNCRD